MTVRKPYNYQASHNRKGGGVQGQRPNGGLVQGSTAKDARTIRTTHLLTEPENAATSNFSTAGTHLSRYPNRILTRYVMFVPMSALQRARGSNRARPKG